GSGLARLEDETGGECEGAGEVAAVDLLAVGVAAPLIPPEALGGGAEEQGEAEDLIEGALMGTGEPPLVLIEEHALLPSSLEPVDETRQPSVWCPRARRFVKRGPFLPWLEPGAVWPIVCKRHAVPM